MMNAEKYWNKCLQENSFKENGRYLTKIGLAMEQWNSRFPREPCALIKRVSSAKSGWGHVMVPAFYVDTYVKEHNYDGEEWYSVAGSYAQVKLERAYITKKVK
jgi:hypothetical protein